MRRLRRLAALVVCVCLGVAALGAYPARAGTFEQWVSFNDGLWGSEITCLWNTPDGRVLAGTDHEGIYMTQDAGLHWQWSGEGLPNLGTPAEPVYGRILSLMGGDGSALIYAATRSGFYASGDQGTTWKAITTGPTGVTVYCAATDPAAAQTVLAGTNNGVYLSRDGGATWTARNTTMHDVIVTRFVYDLAMKDGVFACTMSGLYKSLDRGATWHSASTGLSGGNVQCLAQDPKRPDIMYAGTTGGIARSFDEGGSWTILGGAGRASVLDIQIDSFDSSLVGMVTTQGIFISQDGGEHWSKAYDNGSAQITCALWQRLEVTPDVLLGTHAGLVAVSHGAGVKRVEKLGSPDVTAVAYDPNARSLFAVRGSFLYSSDGTHTWQAIENNLGNARAYGLAIDRNEPRLMYAATEYGILRSTDGGRSWIQLAVTPSDTRGRIQAVAVDPADGRFVYGGNDYGLYRSDGGFQQAWTSVGPAQVSPVVAVAMATMDGTTLYISSGREIWKTTDRCETWHLVSSVVPFSDLTCLMADGSLLYAGSGDGVWTSADGGTSWLPLGTGLRGLLVNSIAVGPQGQVLAGTSKGFFVSRTAEDSAGPTIRLSTPADGTVVSSPQVTVSGTVSDTGSGLASFVINDKATAVNAQSGQFAVDVTLKVGINHLIVRARDMAGNVTEVPLTVTYQYKVVLELTVGSAVMKIQPDRMVALDSPPVIANGRTLVAIRPIVEALGGTVVWAGVDRKVSILQGDHAIELWIDKPTAKVDGKVVLIDTSSSAVAPKIISGRTMLPLRFVTEALGAQVDWDATAKRITITYEGGA